MNKTLLSAAMAATLGFVAAGTASAADGKISFKGTISDVTCTVTGGAGTDAGVQNFTVTLPTVGKTALATSGSRAGDTLFSVIFGGAGQTGCTNGKVASLRFEAAQSPVDAATGRLINSTGAGSAAVVQVGLLNNSKQDINLYSGANSPSATIAGNTATVNYWAQYYAPAAGVTAGSVDTYVMYSVVYN